MKRLSAAIAIILTALLLSACGTVYRNPYRDIPKPIAVMTMENGAQITFVLDPASAPNTVSNFINLANSGFYDGLKLDYIYPTYFMRGGDPNGDGTGGPDYTIDGEFKNNGFPLNEMLHVKGVISMCRLDSNPDDPDSAGSQFFIMLGTHSEYNGAYAAFGYIDPGDTASFAALDSLSNVMLDNNYRPLLKQQIQSIRVDTKGYDYFVIKHGETKAS